MNGTNVTLVGGCNELPAWGPPVGIVLGTIASIGINVGQNLQADGLRKLPEELRDKSAHGIRSLFCHRRILKVRMTNVLAEHRTSPDCG